MHKSCGIRSFFRSWFVVAMGALGCATQALGAVVRHEDALGSFLPRPAMKRVVSDDLKKIAMVICEADKCHVMVNGQPGVRFDKIKPQTLHIVPASQEICYAAVRGENVFLIVGTSEARTSIPASSYESLKLVVGQNAGRALLVHEKGGKTFVTVSGEAGDSKEEGPYDKVSYPLVSADGRAAYVAQADGRMLVVMNGNVIEKHDSVLDLQFSPDGKRYSYRFTDAGISRYMIDGKPSVELGAFTSPLVFSKDSARYGFSTSSQEGPSRYVIDGQIHNGPSAGGVTSPVVFGDDSRHVAYVVANERQELAYVIDGVTGPYTRAVGEISIWSSASGFRYAYIRQVRGSRWAIVTDRGEGRSFHRPLEPLRLTWSDDGRAFTHLALRNHKDTASLVVKKNNSVVTPVSHTAAGAGRFGPAGRQLAHLARSGKGSFYFVIDAKRVFRLTGYPFSGVVAEPGGFAFIEARGSELFRVLVKPQ